MDLILTPIHKNNFILQKMISHGCCWLFNFSNYVCCHRCRVHGMMPLPSPCRVGWGAVVGREIRVERMSSELCELGVRMLRIFWSKKGGLGQFWKTQNLSGHLRKFPQSLKNLSKFQKPWAPLASPSSPHGRKPTLLAVVKASLKAILNHKLRKEKSLSPPFLFSKFYSIVLQSHCPLSLSLSRSSLQPLSLSRSLSPSLWFNIFY